MLFLLLGFPAAQAAQPSTEAVLTTKMALRDLWVEHVFWVRNYVYATSAKDEARQSVSENGIVANAKALAGTIEPFYGKEASDGLFNLLAGHWGAIKSYNAATFGSEKAAQKAALDKLTSNAREIASFLSKANPYLPEKTVFSLLAAHGGHHVQQINEVSAGDYGKEAGTWEQMRKHMHVISDAITDALAKQFPDKF
jgi:hypothetical protein